MDVTPDLDETFTALGDGTRRSILNRLTEGELGLAELAQPFDMTQTAVSKHVKVLSNAGLVHVEKRGRTRYCRLNARRLEAAAAWLGEYESFWADQVQNLGDHFTSEDDR